MSSSSSSSEDSDDRDDPFQQYIKSLKIPFEDIVFATDDFADKYLVKESSSCNVYLGRLWESGDMIDIYVHKYHGSDANVVAGNELNVSFYALMHENVISVFKCCLKKGNGPILIYKREPYRSLDERLDYLNQALGWMRILHISVRVADALKFLHNDVNDDHHVIHGKIRSSKILLDENGEPKIYDFGSAFIAKKHHLYYTPEYNGKSPYSDPEYENSSKSLTHKSDVFSFGVLLFELLFGREASIQDNDHWYFARLARSHYQDKKLDDLIDPDLREEMGSQSLGIFAETAYCCIKEQRIHRPDMILVLSKLEEALELQHKFENQASSSKHLKEKRFDHLKFSLQDIKSATDDFSNEKKIGSGGFGEVYKAELWHLDEINSLAIEEKAKVKISNKVSTVAIKRIFSKNGELGEQGFVSEIVTLSNCKHRNIVSLQGFCNEGEHMILVYEYISNGSLADYWENIDSMTNLTWVQRIQICLDIAHGLEYLHTSTADKPSIIHRDIKSANILLDDKWVAKIADFGFSKLHQANQQGSTIVTKNIAGTDFYLDPEYKSTGKLKAKSDVYSFGVVLFEIMCGKLAYHKSYGQNGLPTKARQCFKEGTLKSLVDPKILEARVIGRVNQDSFDTFTKVAHKCLAEIQLERPTIEVVIIELQKALNFQIDNEERLCISLNAINLGTQDFNDSNCIGEGRFWKFYKGEVVDANGCTAIIAKRWDRKPGQGRMQLLRELDILSRYKHKSIIGLVGYCIEMDENILVYEHASNGTLDRHLDDPNLTWMTRLKISIDVASGLKFLHKRDGVNEEDCVIHRNIKSSSILLDDNWNAKIANFELSSNESVRERAKHVDDNACDSLGYIDPQYQINGFLTRFSDIYSFGVILIEMLYGRLSWAKGCEDHSQSLGQLALTHYNERKDLNEMIFEDIKKQIAPESLTEFVNSAILSLDYRISTSASTSAKQVVNYLSHALTLQKLFDDNNFHISLEAIKKATGNFSDHNCIGEGRCWKLYEGEIADAKGSTTIFAKRWDSKSQQGHIQHLQTELHTLTYYKHKNIIGLVGYCIEMDENIIVYEHAYNGRLDKQLCNPSLTWMKRLNICLDVVKGLRFIHKDFHGEVDSMVHGDIKSSSILLDDNWKAKICNFELSLSCKKILKDKVGHLEYGLSKVFDWDKYSFGLILIEMLCGRMAWGEECKDQSRSMLGSLAVSLYNEKGCLDEMIFEGIKQQISPESLTPFLKIAFQCLEDGFGNYVSMEDMEKELEEALKLQEDHETWDPRLPMDYKEIFPAPILSAYNCMKKDIYAMFCSGVPLEDGKTLFTLGSNGERNELISARMFSYKNRKSRKWLSIEDTWFEKVAKMSDISKLKIKIKITTRFLSPGVNYGAYLIFKFCDSRKISSKPMYVNLKYKMGGENLHAYFATWRDDEWMEIEVCRFFSHKKDTDFKVLLESFSRSHCGNGSIHVEGIEFRVIDNVQNKDIEQVQQIQKSNSNTDHPFDEQLLSLNEVNRKKHLMLSATEVLFDSYNRKHFHVHPSTESRFHEVVEVITRDVFQIQCKIEIEMLSQDTDYWCYLVFKLSKNCVGLHCPVRVRDICIKRNKNVEIVYFRSPNPWNLHENNTLPIQREDEWMEVKVWKFNSCHQLKYGRIPVHLTLMTYEGTMSGLIICGMEFRPV